MNPPLGAFEWDIPYEPNYELEVVTVSSAFTNLYHPLRTLNLSHEPESRPCANAKARPARYPGNRIRKNPGRIIDMMDVPAPAAQRRQVKARRGSAE